MSMQQKLENIKNETGRRRIQIFGLTEVCMKDDLIMCVECTQGYKERKWCYPAP